MKKTSTLALAICMLVLNFTVKAQISGTVFRDYNNNGTRDAVTAFTEPMVPGVIVNAYNSADILIASFTTNSGTGFPYVAPNYSIPASGIAYNGTQGSNTGFITSAINIRLEFIIPSSGTCLVNSSYDFSAKSGGTSVQFVVGGATNVNYGINNQQDYVFDVSPFSNTFLFIPTQATGNPLLAGTSSNSNAFLKIPYNRGGTTALAAADILATNAQIGTTYGTAYSKQANKIFTSAFLKRHSGFGPANGTFNNAPGAIYIIDPTKNSTTVAASYFTSLDALGVATHNTTGSPAYGSPTSFTLTNNAGVGGARTETITYVGTGEGVIGTNVIRGLNANTATPSNDAAAFGQVGKVSLGDIEISDDGLYIFVTNFYDRKIYQLQLNSITNPTSASVVTSWALPNPPLRSTSGLTNASTTYSGATDNTDFYTGLRGIQRPFGLKYYRGKLYIGAVTTGEGASGSSITDNNDATPEYTDLWAYVWELNPVSGTFTSTPSIQFPLNFNRATDPNTIDETWKPWTRTMPTEVPSGGGEWGYAQPMFAGIEFDVDGTMILGFRDRAGDQGGVGQYMLSTTTSRTLMSNGDQYRAYKNQTTCSFEFEKNAKEGASSPKAATAGANSVGNGATSTSGPSDYAGKQGEFYYQDGLERFNGAAGDASNWHLNTCQGSITMLRGTNQCAASYMDPLSLFSGGISWMDNTTGGNARDYQVQVGSAVGDIGKASGLGDIELFTKTPSIELGNRVWNDINGDGIQNPGEAGIAGVTLEFVDALGNAVDGDPATAGIQATFVTTDANGNWYISSATGTDATGINYGVALLPNSIYKVKLASGASDDWDPTANAGAGGPRAGQQLIGFCLTKTNSVGSGAADLSDNDASLISSIPEITITTGDYGQNNHTLDIGFKQLASLGDRVWLDTNKDGLQNGTEPGVADVSVNLYQNGTDGLPGTADDVLVGSTITDAYGNYLFENLTPTNQTNATTIGQTSYNIRVTASANYSFTTQTNTTDDNLNIAPSTTGSDVNVLGISYGVNLSSGENNLNIDAGLIFKTAPAVNSIGDRVWFDNGAGALGGNGGQDAGEPGVSGITVTLYDDVTGNIVAITTTDANGNYIFNNLPANTNYKVGFSAPAGTVFTTGGTLSIGNATTNSDVNPTTGLTTTINTGVAGTQITGVDAGIKNDAKGALGDYVWNDVNNNGIQDAGELGVAGVTMKLYGPGLNGVVGGGDDVLLSTTTTDANGYYVYPNLDPAKYFVVATPVAGYTNSTANQGSNNTKDTDFGAGTGTYAGTYVSGSYTLLPTAGGVTRDMTVDLGIHSNTANLNSLGDRVWNDVNKDGLQTVGESGVPNVTVRLLDNIGNPVNNPATGKPYVVVTDANGNYKFVDLADGSYIVEFANIPVGYSFTSQDASGTGAPGSGTDGTNDSDAKTTTGRTAVISVDATSASATSVNIVTVDAGISQGISAGTASLGNRVWYDINNNGLQDAGELGVNNVKVELLDAAGATVNVPTTAIPYVVYTNALGEYLFTGLPAGDYTVRFSRLPAGFTSSTSNTGTDDALDADASYAGAAVTATTTATTGIYTLQTGEDNLTVDMGIVPATGSNSLGNFVWNDGNNDGIQTVGEPGVQGVMVTLYTNGVDGLPGTADDVRVGVTTTDVNGAYGFVGLVDGNYNVGFSNLPAGFKFSTKDAAGSTAANGSDANEASGRTGTIALDPTSISATGINNPDVDAGINSTRASLGNYVWLDTNGDGVQDATEKGVSGVTVTLYDDITSVVASTVTDANGRYYFPNLNAGLYQVGFSTLPSGLSFTTKDVTTGPDGDGANTWLGGGDSDVNTSGAFSGRTDIFSLATGETNLKVDAGLKPNNDASVGNYVWNDQNNNGVQDATETGVPGVIVTLYDLSNNVIGSAVTDGNGNYLISKIPAATTGTSYYIIFSNLPGTATFTTRTDNVTAGDATLGSDPNTATGRTSNFTLTPGQYLPTVDAGIINVLILPIKITSFTALPKGSQVDLQWTISEQINVASYQVLFSTDGRNFNTSIATVAANNNTSATYNAVHTTAVAGINYYRIKTIEKDGTISYSEIRKVTFGKAGTITVYPNPTVDMVNITLTGSMINKAATLSILSVDGKILSQQNIASLGQTETMDVSRFANGTYIVRLVANDEVINKTIQVLR